MTYRALIVDDERFARLALAELLRERGDVVVVGEVGSVSAAVSALVALDPDVVFLDVRLRDESGFTLFDRTNVRAHVVFVTAYAEHAVRAFSVDALDYLLKPVQRRDLDRALAKAAGRLAGSGRVSWPPPTVPPREPDPAPLQLSERVCLQCGSEIVFTRTEGIVLLRAARDYTIVHLASRRSQRLREPLQRWEERLPKPPFLRIHRSLIINTVYLDRLFQEGGSWHVMLSTVEGSLPVSRRLMNQVREHLGSAE